MCINRLVIYIKFLGGIINMREIKIEINKCVGNGVCTDICPTGAIELYEVGGGRKKVRVKDIQLCVECHSCQQHCPHDAIKVYPPIEERLRAR
jgi:ferredoxin